MNKKDYFVPKMYRNLIVPSIASSAGMALADMADALVLGLKMGETGLAAIGLCLPVFMLINFLMDGFGLGGCIRYSQKLGEGDAKGANDCFNRIWTATLAAGLAIGLIANIFSRQFLFVLGTTPADGELYTACESYMRIIAAGAPFLMLNIVFSGFLRNDNNAELAAKGFLIGNVTDITLNIVLVLFFDMGTVGAALATVIGSVTAICLYLPGILFKSANLLKVKKFSVNFGETFSCFKNGFSTSVQNLFQLIFFLLVNHIIIGLGGENGMAVFDVMYNASFLIIYLCNGAAEAAQPLVSTFMGENNYDDCRTVLKLSLRYALIMSGVAAALIFIFADKVALLFGISAELTYMASAALRIYCTGFAFAAANIILEKHCQAKENTKEAFCITFMRDFAVLVPCVFLLSFTGIEYIWLMYPLTELVSFILFALYSRFTAGREDAFDSERILRITVSDQQQDIGELLSRSETFCEKWDANPNQVYFVTLIIEEVCMSIIRNALKKVPDGKIRITLLAMESGDFMLHVLDNAVAFNPFSHKEKKVGLNEEFDIDDVSIMLIKKKSKEFMYRQCHGFNSLVVRI